MDTEILVKRTATLRVMPDRAVLQVEVDGEGQSRDEAYRQAAPLATAVDGVVERHRPADRPGRHRVPDGPPADALEARPVGPHRVAGVADDDPRGHRVRRPRRPAGRAGDRGRGGRRARTGCSTPTTPCTSRPAGRRPPTPAPGPTPTRDALGLRVTGLAWLAEPGLRQGGGPDYPVALGRGGRPADGGRRGGGGHRRDARRDAGAGQRRGRLLLHRRRLTARARTRRSGEQQVGAAAEGGERAEAEQPDPAAGRNRA